MDNDKVSESKNIIIWSAIQSALAFLMVNAIIGIVFLAVAYEEFETSPGKTIILFIVLQIILITSCISHYKNKKKTLLLKIK